MQMKAEDYFNNCIGVFQGGGCKAVAYVGAYKAAYEKGIMFSEVAGTSAGSIIAALIAVGCSPAKLEELVREADFSNILKLHHGNRNWCLRIIVAIIAAIIAAIITIVTALILLPIVVIYGIYFWFVALWKRCVKHIDYEWPLSKVWKFIPIGYKTLYALGINSLGLHDSRVIMRLVETWFEQCGKSPDITFSQLNVGLRIVSTDVRNHKAKVWSAKETGDEKVSKAVAASCCIPFFFAPTDDRYVDGCMVSNRPDYLFCNEPHKYTKILSFVLGSPKNEYNSLSGFVKELFSTIIDGSDELQHDIISEVVTPVSIPYAGIEPTDFDKLSDPLTIDKLIETGYKALCDYMESLDDDMLATRVTKARGRLDSRERVYTEVASWSYHPAKEIIVYENTLDWVWALFPTLIHWINSKTKVIVFSEDNKLTVSSSGIVNTVKERRKCSADEAREWCGRRLQIRNARKRLLEALGCKVLDFNENKIKGFFFKSNRPDTAHTSGKFRGIVINYDNQISSIIENNDLNAKIYADDIDASVISQQISATKLTENFSGMSKPQAVKLVFVDEDEIISRIKGVRYYRDADFSWETIELTRLKFLNPMLRGFKYTQCMHTFNMYGAPENLYRASAIELPGGYKSYMSPVVVEEHDGVLYVIKGNTRCLYAYRQGISEIVVLVVRNVNCELPVSGDLTTYNVSELFVAEGSISGETRYGSTYDYSKYRHIEETLRPYGIYLQ